MFCLIFIAGYGLVLSVCTWIMQQCRTTCLEIHLLWYLYTLYNKINTSQKRAVFFIGSCFLNMIAGLIVWLRLYEFYVCQPSVNRNLIHPWKELLIFSFLLFVFCITLINRFYRFFEYMFSEWTVCGWYIVISSKLGAKCQTFGETLHLPTNRMLACIQGIFLSLCGFKQGIFTKGNAFSFSGLTVWCWHTLVW